MKQDIPSLEDFTKLSPSEQMDIISERVLHTQANVTFNGKPCKNGCNCIEIAEHENGGQPVKNYSCRKPQEPEAYKTEIKNKAIFDAMYAPCENCGGGHIRPCQHCGDSGFHKILFTKKEMEEYANQKNTQQLSEVTNQAIIDTQIFYGHNPTRGKHQTFRETYLQSLISK